MQSTVSARRPRQLALPAALCVVLAAANPLSPAAAHTTAQILPVLNCNDSGSGSLRAVYATALDGDVVDLSQLACSTITLTGGPIISASDAGYVSLQGPSDHVLTLDGGHAGRVIVHTGTRLGLNFLNVTAGAANDSAGGGCIYSSGDVALGDVTVSDCTVTTTGATPARGGAIHALRGVHLSRSRVVDSSVHAAAADADGGGIHARYLLTYSQSTISGNSAIGDGTHYARGGGAFVSAYASSAETTFSGNSAESGGALFIGGANGYTTPKLVNTTIHGNHAGGAGAGVFANRSIAIDNSTIAGNDAGFEFGAGLYLGAGDAQLHSTIVANNVSGIGPADIAGHAGAAITGAHNLVLASTLALPGDTIAADPKLAPLADNGGGVLTQALLPGSSAIDAGENPHALYVDERSVVCPAGGQCQTSERTIGMATDIGAFEFGAPDHVFAAGFDPED